MPIPGPETTLKVREGLERACKDFTSRIAPLGFSRTKKMFWTRRHEMTVDVIHFHRSGSTYGSSINFRVNIRVHFAIRALNDTLEAIAINGPYSDPSRLRQGLYHLSFNAQSGHMYDRCVEDLLRFVLEQGEPWFRQFENTDSLLATSGSPLTGTQREALGASIAGNADPSNVAQSLKLLGIKS